MQELLNALNQLETTMYAYRFAVGVIYVDSATVAPGGAAEARGIALGVLSEKSYREFVCDETKTLLEKLHERRGELDQATARRVQVLRKKLRHMTCIPMDEYVAYAQLTNEAESVWQKAKAKNDYALFEPYLKKLIECNRKFAGYMEPGKPVYDAMLDENEQGMTTETLDGFFGTLRETVVPLIAKVKDSAVSDDFLKIHAPKETQEALSAWLMEKMELDPERCVLSTSEHPVTMGLNKKDVRITTHYHENDFTSSMYSVIHEGGHALYELGVADEYQQTCIAQDLAMGIHESQSRFYENLVGRSEAFCEILLPKLKELFPQAFENVTVRQLYRAVNKVQPSLIRTEADEVTYPLHIMVRYELEKRLFDGTLDTAELPAEWNRLYRDYLGVEVPDDAQGVLQDIHWAGGMFAYFPSYALGSAYGAQLLHHMKKDVDVTAAVLRGDLHPVTEWLRDQIHRFGDLYDPGELLEKACGEAFDPKYYAEYLTEKITKLYPKA